MAIKDMIRAAIRSEFRPLSQRTGFRGAGRAWEYRRRMGEVVQSIEFQVATVVQQEADFSIHVGLSFDGLRTMGGRPLAAGVERGLPVRLTVARRAAPR